VRVAVDLVAGFCIDAAAAADDLAVALERDVEPDLVGVDGSLVKRWPRVSVRITVSSR